MPRPVASARGTAVIPLMACDGYRQLSPFFSPWAQAVNPLAGLLRAVAGAAGGRRQAGAARTRPWRAVGAALPDAMAGDRTAGRFAPAG